jgi:hypothetical protein
MLCTHRFNDSSMAFPEHMHGCCRRNEILDAHDYLRVCVDGEWIDVDATWPLALRDFGLPAETGTARRRWSSASSPTSTKSSTAIRRRRRKSGCRS